MSLGSSQLLQHPQKILNRNCIKSPESTSFWECLEGINWALHFGSQVGRNLILHMGKHQEMAQSHRTAPAPFWRGPSGPETHAAAISPSLRDKGMSWVNKIANGDPPPVDCCIYRLPVNHEKNGSLWHPPALRCWLPLGTGKARRDHETLLF